MTTVIVPFSGNANYQLEINITAGAPDPTTGDILVTHSRGIRQIGGANVSGTGTISWGNGHMGEDGLPFSYNFTGYDYLDLGSGTYTSPRRFSDGSELEGYPAVYNDTTVTTSSLGTASGTAHAVPPGTPNATIPTLSPVSVVAGQPLTIGLPAENPSYTHDISYSIGWNQSPKQPIASGVVGSSYVWQIPLSLRSNGMNFKIWVATYNGATKLGDRLVYGNLLIPTGVEASVTGFSSIDDNLDVATKVGKYVQSLSTLRLTDIAATAKNGASIADSWLSIEGVNIKTGETRALVTGGSVPVTAVARDSRGVQGVLNSTVPVLPYNGPTLTVPFSSPTGSNIYRSTSGGVYAPEGSNLTVTYVASVASLVNSTERNTITVRISTREFDGTTWTVRNTITPATTLVGGRRTTAALTAVVGGGAIYSADTSYVVRIEVIDQFNTLVREDTVSTAFVTIDLDGQNVGIAKLHERGTLDVGGDGYFEGLYNRPKYLLNANQAYYAGDYVVSLGTQNLPSGAITGNAYITAEVVDSVIGGYLVGQKYHKVGSSDGYTRTLNVSSTGTFQSSTPWVVDITSGRGSGTSAERLAITGTKPVGAVFYETDTGIEWVWSGTEWKASQGGLPPLQSSGGLTAHSITVTSGFTSFGTAVTIDLAAPAWVRVEAHGWVQAAASTDLRVGIAVSGATTQAANATHGTDPSWGSILWVNADYEQRQMSKYVLCNAGVNNFRWSAYRTGSGAATIQYADFTVIPERWA